MKTFNIRLVYGCDFDYAIEAPTLYQAQEKGKKLVEKEIENGNFSMEFFGMEFQKSKKRSL